MFKIIYRDVVHFIEYTQYLNELKEKIMILFSIEDDFNLLLPFNFYGNINYIEITDNEIFKYYFELCKKMKNESIEIIVEQFDNTIDSLKRKILKVDIPDYINKEKY